MFWNKKRTKRKYTRFQIKLYDKTRKHTIISDYFYVEKSREEIEQYISRKLLSTEYESVFKYILEYPKKGNLILPAVKHAVCFAELVSYKITTE